MFVVDTNVFLYAADESFPEHSICIKLLRTWRAQNYPWFTTWSILYEFQRIVTHPQVLKKPWTAPESLRFIQSMLASPSLTILTHTPRHSLILESILNEIPKLRGNILHDVHTAALMREHGVHQIYTRDEDFHRFPFIEVLNPMNEK